MTETGEEDDFKIFAEQVQRCADQADPRPLLCKYLPNENDEHIYYDQDSLRDHANFYLLAHYELDQQKGALGDHEGNEQYFGVFVHFFID